MLLKSRVKPICQLSMLFTAIKRPFPAGIFFLHASKRHISDFSFLIIMKIECSDPWIMRQRILLEISLPAIQRVPCSLVVMKRDSHKKSQIGVFSHNFNNFLLTKFCHPPVHKKLGDNPDNCRTNADNSGIKNVF